MSKSTPLGQLNKNQAQGPSEEEKESLLVNEILNEINKDEEQVPDNINMNVEMPSEELVEPTPPPQVMEQRPATAPIPPVNQEQEESNEEAARRMFNVGMEQPEETTMLQEFLNNLRAPVIVGALVVLFSLPKVSDVLSSLVPPREILQKFKLPVVLLMKFILSAVVYFAINMAM